MEKLDQIRKDIVDAKKELTLIKQDKERTLLEVEHLSDEKVKSLEDIKKYQLIGNDYKLKSEEAQNYYSKLMEKIDVLINQVNNLEGKAKHISDNADAKTMEANKLMEDVISKLSLVKAEQQKLKEDRASFDEKLRQNTIKEFDYQRAYKDLEVIRIAVEIKDKRLNVDIENNENLRQQLQDSIEHNKQSIAALTFQIQDIKLKKTNYLDAMSELNEKISTVNNNINVNDKLRKELTNKLALAEENIKSTRRNFSDLINKENELKLKQLKFEKLLRDKNMVEELKKYEDNLAS